MRFIVITKTDSRDLYTDILKEWDGIAEHVVGVPVFEIG